MVWLLLTVVAVSLGTIRWFPMVTVALAVWILPAVAHTYLSCRILRTRVPAVDFSERLDRFGMALVWSLVALFVTLVCGTLAIFLAQAMDQILQWYFGFELPMSTSNRVFAAVLGLLAGGLVLWLTLPQAPRHRESTHGSRN